ncbi:hypothetical protein Hypma_002180 [Hypsizygus marmoreus]|uniref:DUF6593 domain-containing protein n=1 Tax=Hypsizygus marmoreus TaxID=39966 RepID=A0A369K558_HYPMA|nr:hypothetical protein Hypma_002180 [Hypsizygus marmoreus]
MNLYASKRLGTPLRSLCSLVSHSLFPSLNATVICSMYHSHPYAGWAAGHGQSLWPTSPPPSVLGALPYPTLPAPSNLMAFYITDFSPTILNSRVVGPQGQEYFTITTNNEMPGYTVVKNTEGASIALVEWKTPPMVEIRGLLSKRDIKTWLPLSPDRSSRAMEVRRMRYHWAPHNDSINLYSGVQAATFLASISRTRTSLVIQMTTDALQLQLLDSVVIAALLLQCGRNID